MKLTQQYKDLFALVARNGAINGEKAMDVISEKNPEEDLTNTKKMTQDFRDLEDKIEADEELTLLDFIHLWVGASISRTVIAKNVDTWTAVVKAYDEDLIPKLYEVAQSSNDDTKWQELVEEYFCKNLSENSDENKIDKE
jgi:hypothetical protein